MSVSSSRPAKIASEAVDAVRRHTDYRARLDLSTGSLGILCGAMTVAASLGAYDEDAGCPERDGPTLLTQIASDCRPFHGGVLRRAYMAGRRQARLGDGR